MCSCCRRGSFETRSNTSRITRAGSARARGCAGSRYPFLTQKERDVETQLDSFLARYYSSVQGRFTGADTVAGLISDPQSMNLYAYVDNNPLRYIDPTGHALSDIGVYQTKNPEVERKVTRAEDQGIKNWVAEQARPPQPRTGLLVGPQGIPQKPVPQPAPDPGQLLSPCVKNRLRPYFSGVNLDGIRVQEGIPDYVVGDPLAYTEGNRIYYKKGRYDPHSVQGLSDLGHEVTHSEQYAKLGTINFQAQYLGEYLELRRLGFDHETAYENISFEVEARKRAEIIKKDLTNLMRDFGGRDPCPR